MLTHQLASSKPLTAKKDEENSIANSTKTLYPFLTNRSDRTDNTITVDDLCLLVTNLKVSRRRKKLSISAKCGISLVS